MRGDTRSELLRCVHLIPKRMGTEGAKSVLREFVVEEAALQVHRFHPMIGTLLFGPLGDLVDLVSTTVR